MNKSVFNILIVCTGNTCRSPMAEGILKSILAERGIENIHVESAGIGALNGMPATPFAVEVARNWNIDISAHRARQLDEKMIDHADLILAMSTEHVEAILRKKHSAASKTYLLKGFPSPYSSSQESIRDPIGGNLEEYGQTFLELDEAFRRIEGRIIELIDSSKKGD